MRRTLIRNADLVVTMEPRLGDGALGLIPSGDVLIEDDRIAAVGQGLDGSGARIVDATGKIVLPGFVDVHNHLWQALIRGCGTSLAVGEWLQTCVFPMSRLNVTAEEAYAVVRLSTLDLLSTGVTTVVDWSHAFSPDFARGNVQALLDSGLRFAFVCHGRVERVEDMRVIKRDMIDPNPRASLQIGGVQPTMAEEVLHTLRSMAELAGEMHVMLHVHLLEAEYNRQEEPLRALDLAGVLGPTLIGAHAVHVMMRSPCWPGAACAWPTVRCPTCAWLLASCGWVPSMPRACGLGSAWMGEPMTPVTCSTICAPRSDYSAR